MGITVTYPACREYLKYLELIITEPHAMITIAGGLGYLHLVNENTRNLLVIDHNQTQLSYARFIHQLIEHSHDVFQFLSLISNRKVNRHRGLCSECITDERLDGHLLLPDALAQNYQLFRNDRYTGVMYFDDWWTEEREYTFSWYFGKQYPFSAFQDNDTFLRLQHRLRTITVAYQCASLERLDFSEFQSKEVPYICLSNTIDSYYAKDNDILHRIRETMKPGQIHFMGWLGDVDKELGLAKILLCGELKKPGPTV